MFGTGRQGRGQGQVSAVGRDDGRSAASQRAGLVGQQHRDGAGLLQRDAVSNQNAAPRGHVGARHDRRRRGQSHGARTRHDQHRDRAENRRGQGRRRHVWSPQIAAEQRAEVTGFIGRQSPPQRRPKGDRHHDGDEHIADPVGQALNVCPAVLRPLDGGENPGQGRGVADGRHLHDRLPVQIHRPRIDAPARSLFHRQRLAGQHRFVHAALAFDQLAVRRDAVPWPQNDLLTRLKFPGGHFRFRSIGVAAARGGRGQLEQGAQRFFRVAGGARLQPVAHADQRDDGGRFHEIEMSARAGEERPNAVAEGRRRTQRHQRVHVRPAQFQLSPRAPVKRSAAINLHRRRQRKRQPMKPGRHAQPKNPFARHQRRRAQKAGDHVVTPTVQGRGPFRLISRRGRFGLVTRRAHRCGQSGNIRGRARLPADPRPALRQRNIGPGHARNALQRLRNVPRAVGAVHPPDLQFAAKPGLNRRRHTMKLSADIA